MPVSPHVTRLAVSKATNDAPGNLADEGSFRKRTGMFGNTSVRTQGWAYPLTERCAPSFAFKLWVSGVVDLVIAPFFTQTQIPRRFSLRPARLKLRLRIRFILRRFGAPNPLFRELNRPLHLGEPFFAMPRKRRRYNDDVAIDHYKPDVIRFAGVRRSGTHETLSGFRDYEDRVRQALNGRFPLSHVAPLPPGTRGAAVFVRDAHEDTIAKVRGAHLAGLEKLAHDITLAQSEWNACIPAEIAPEAGKFQTVAMQKLMNQLDMGDRNGSISLPSDPRLLATFPRNTSFPRSLRNTIACQRGVRSAESRFMGREAHSGRKNA